MDAVTLFSPAKLNLFLAITGKRPDGYHDLVSVVVPLAWADLLTATTAAPGRFGLVCTDPAVPTDGTNLVLKAAAAFVAATGWGGGVAFRLEKRLPMQAGLGGGSSNAAAALLALDRLAGTALPADRLMGLAAQVGSDCAVFVTGRPAVMRGRGERVEALPEAAAARLKGRRVLVFKPDFGVATAWAYAHLPGLDGAAAAEARLAAWLGDPSAPAEALLYNHLEQPVFAKYRALPALLAALRADFGLEPRMSGSGSACFALLPPAGGPDVKAVTAAIRAAWGESALVMESTIG